MFQCMYTFPILANSIKHCNSYQVKKLHPNMRLIQFIQQICLEQTACLRAKRNDHIILTFNLLYDLEHSLASVFYFRLPDFGETNLKVFAGSENYYFSYQYKVKSIQNNCEDP